MSFPSISDAARESEGLPDRDYAASAVQHFRAGQKLVEKGLISSGELGSALADQMKWQSNLGEVLIGKGLVRPFDYYQALAAVQELPFVNLRTDPPDASLLRPADRAHYSRLQLLPWRIHQGRTVIASVDIGDAQRTFAEERYGTDGFRFVITSPFDVFWALQSRFRDSDSLQAREALYLWKPQHSAKLTVTRSQRAIMIILGLAYLAWLVAAPRACLVATMAAITVLYTVTFLFKFLLTWVGSSHKVDMDVSSGSGRCAHRRGTPRLHGARTHVPRGSGAAASLSGAEEARLPGVKTRGEAYPGGGRHRDDRGGEGAPAARHFRDRPRAGQLSEDQVEGLQLRAASLPAASSSRSTTPRTSPSPTS